MNDHDLLVEINTKVNSIHDTVKGHSPRIRRLEQFKTYCVGSGAVIVGLIGWLKHGGS